VLGHTAPGIETQTEDALHRGTKEFQAEATAYLTLNELETLSLDTASHSRGYIQGWLRGERRVTQSSDRCLPRPTSA
jgi:hypothetical protein